MINLAAVLAQSRRRGRCAFVPYITAGDPSLAATAAFVETLGAAGADIIELGVPFSDPVADGPTIQAAAGRALRAKTTLLKVLELVAGLRRRGCQTPIILFTYLNPVLQLGYENFARRCARSGVQGVLVVDLPVESGAGLEVSLHRHKIEPVLLASPTTSNERLKRIGRVSGSIVYYISREGVTGVRQGLAAGLKERLKKVKALVKKPLIVGFGVATTAQARALAPWAGGVVVGSALVAAIARSSSVKKAQLSLSRSARQILAGLEVSC